MDSTTPFLPIASSDASHDVPEPTAPSNRPSTAGLVVPTSNASKALPIIHIHPEGASVAAGATPTVNSPSTPAPDQPAHHHGAPDSQRLSVGADDRTNENEAAMEETDAEDWEVQQGGQSQDPLNTDDLSRMPPMGAKFKTRMGFETACRSAIPATADYCFRIWKSLEVETSRRYGKNAFVELGCRHLDNTKCSSATFRVRAVHNKEGEWVIVKRTLIHDNHGPLGGKKRRGSAPKGTFRGKKKAVSATGSVNTSRSATPGFDDSASDTEMPYSGYDARNSSNSSSSTRPRLSLNSQTAGSIASSESYPTRAPEAPGNTLARDRTHLRRNVTEPTKTVAPTSGQKRSYFSPRFTLPVKMPRVDVPLYCYCNYPAYGDMIACSGDHCEKQYFHIGCVRRHAQQPMMGWKCFDCTEQEQRVATTPIGETASDNAAVRPADEVFHKHLYILSIVAAAHHPEKISRHGPIVAFLNCLNPTLGDACGHVLYDKGLVRTERLQNMNLSEWQAFIDYIRKDNCLSAFDLFTLDRTMVHWIQHGYAAINKL